MTALKRLTVSYNELTRLDDVSHMVRSRSNQSEFLYQFCCGLAKFFDPKKKTKLQNYSSKESDMYLISPYSITLKSNIDAMRIKEMTSNSRSSFSWLLDKFSLRYHRKCIENGIESLHADIRILMVFLKIFLSYTMNCTMFPPHPLYFESTSVLSNCALTPPLTQPHSTLTCYQLIVVGLGDIFPYFNGFSLCCCHRWGPRNNSLFLFCRYFWSILTSVLTKLQPWMDWRSV